MRGKFACSASAQQLMTRSQYDVKLLSEDRYLRSSIYKPRHNNPVEVLHPSEHT
jgi:hypothetical protein